MSAASRLDDSVGYCLSAKQLDELWHYDMWLAHILMDLPLRRCNAVPTSTEFPPMDSIEFQKLKEQVRKMWICASTLFVCQESENGWGLFFGSDIEHFVKRLLTPNNPSIMGWLARAPSVKDCPTGHRYLRSPCCKGDQENIYLGGPISLANFHQVNRVECKRCISNMEPRKNKLLVTRAQGLRITAGMEVLWSYNLDRTKKISPNLSSQKEWQLETCCSEVRKNSAGSTTASWPDSVTQNSTLSESRDPAGPPKKRKVGGHMPRKSQSCVVSFKPCTYCGINVPSHIKRHWALTHAKDLCDEMGVQVDDENNPVSAKHFMQHLDKVDHVFNSLNNHNYKIIPACDFFKIMGTPLLELNASSDEKDTLFQKFLSEGRSAFNKYKVLYLKGISVPKSYEDLLIPVKSTNYSSVNWNDTPPSTNNFSLVSYQFTETENEDHALDIKNALTNAVLSWMTSYTN